MGVAGGAVGDGGVTRLALQPVIGVLERLQARLRPAYLRPYHEIRLTPARSSIARQPGSASSRSGLRARWSKFTKSGRPRSAQASTWRAGDLLVARSAQASTWRAGDLLVARPSQAMDGLAAGVSAPPHDLLALSADHPRARSRRQTVVARRQSGSSMRHRYTNGMAANPNPSMIRDATRLQVASQHANRDLQCTACSLRHGT